MEKQTAFDAEKVADLVKRVAEQLQIVDERQKAKAEAEAKLGSAEVGLTNLRRELTRALDGHLDMSTLKQRAPQMHPVDA